MPSYRESLELLSIVLYGRWLFGRNELIAHRNSNLLAYCIPYALSGHNRVSYDFPGHLLLLLGDPASLLTLQIGLSPSLLIMIVVVIL